MATASPAKTTTTTTTPPANLYLVDVECLKVTPSRLFIKECAIVNCLTGAGQTYHLLPPTHITQDKISNKVKGTNNYLRYNRHGFSVESGVVHYHCLYSIFETLFRKQKCVVLVKGLDKLHLLAPFIDTELVKLVDLENLGCPKYELFAPEQKCFLHGQNKLHRYCAEAKANFYLHWWLRNSLCICK
jgi:hypothetical protein